ncbi:MAG: tRNA pseudouridine(55) synthase TruB [Flavobacteriaceae bacterium]|nr:tRNA pseudouridine(55) synthase TruB [Flavobacteriaceae bacterium]
MLKDYSETSFKEGEVLLIDKPLAWTSFQAVNKVRWVIKKTFGLKNIKVGHAGTLDPLATGLLILCTGKETKNIQQYQGLTKEYTGSFFIGATTPSFDLETEIDQRFSSEHIDLSLLKSTAACFLGEQLQKPPIFSAIKKDGKRLYEHARKGDSVEITPRKIIIESFEITNYQQHLAEFRVRCSKGTYIRSLAVDFGKALNSGAYLSALRRTKIGDFEVKNAMSPSGFEALISSAH